MTTQQTVNAVCLGLAALLFASPVFAKDVIVPACDRGASQAVEIVVSLDDEQLADHPEFETIVREAAFWAAATLDFPGPDSYAVFEHLAMPAWMAIENVGLRYTGQACQ